MRTPKLVAMKPATKAVLFALVLFCVLEGGLAGLSRKKKGGNPQDAAGPDLVVPNNGKGQRWKGAEAPDWAKPVPSVSSAYSGSRSVTSTSTLNRVAVKETKVTWHFHEGILIRAVREVRERKKGSDPWSDWTTSEADFPMPPFEQTRRAITVTSECLQGRPAVEYEDLSGQPLWARSGPAIEDIAQGSLGNCWFLASLGAVVSAPSPLGPKFIKDRTKMDGAKRVKLTMWDGFEGRSSSGARICTEATITVPYDRANFKLRKGRLSHHKNNWVTMWVKGVGSYQSSQAQLQTLRDMVEPSVNPEHDLLKREARLKLPSSDGQCTADHADSVGGSAVTGFRIVLGPDYTVRIVLLSERVFVQRTYMDRLWSILNWASSAKNPMTFDTPDRLDKRRCPRYDMRFNKEDHELQGKHVFVFRGVVTKGRERFVHLRDPWGDQDQEGPSDRPSEFLVSLAQPWDCFSSITFVDTAQFLRKGGNTLREWREEGLALTP